MPLDHEHSLHAGNKRGLDILPAGTVGIDAGMTLTKVVRASAEGVALEVHGAGASALAPDGGARVGVTGALAGLLAGGPVAAHVQEIEAAARGASALLAAEGRLGDGEFVLALLGTGTAFAAVRAGRVSHLGGTPLGGGSFSGIARRVEPALSYEEMIARAERGDRRKVDTMIADVYPAGIGRVGPDLTAAHLAHAERGSLDDFLAGLLNLHGENIAQIAASRARIAQVGRIVLAGGFVHNNPRLVASIEAMAGLFGVSVELAPLPGFAGAFGAALAAAAAT